MLRDAFPRCYALAVLKEGTLSDFGHWKGLNWVWTIRTRPLLFGWEEDQWNMFSTFLVCLFVCNNCKDTIAWSANPNGLFTVGSFSRALEDASVKKYNIPQLLWKGFCPPKIDLFMWQLWRGKIVVRELLLKFGMINIPDKECPLCSSGVESLDHFFLKCSWSLLLWRSCMNWWGVQFCINNSVQQWMEAWCGLCPGFKHERSWNSLFCAIVWSIWEVRNKCIFENEEPNVVKATEVVKFRVVWWFKHLGKRSTDVIQLLLLNVKDCCVDSMITKKKIILDWNPPAEEHFKFNVDGSVLSKSGPAGAGGVLRDFNGNILCLFSCHLGWLDSNADEIWAIKVALGLCISNLWWVIRSLLFGAAWFAAALGFRSAVWVSESFLLWLW
ncbi:hypothetical protein Ddye_027156 [Dipteronia dyeriana]|uniref:Reverse transcriptase zinc-binding domain-containing protein n=1 Tax=Dipteronia dyeriana TaxID=168575 RepID=A0AAD9WQ74_9ROSI|nr:hypothetical protein Ddye_027156 [Dipteronia dyeriana]